MYLALSPQACNSLTDSSGRSLNSSKLAFDEMNRQTGFYPLHAPNPYSQQAPQAQIHPTTIPRKRQLPGSEMMTPNFPAIQPKPPGLSPAPYTPVPAESAGSVRPSPGDSATEPAKKRRGRPSNAQIEQEKAAAAAEGREWQPRPPRPPRKRRSKTSRDAPPRSEGGPSDRLIPQTPEIQMVEAQEESSSGKKRRRTAREEPPVVRAAPYDPVRQSPSLPEPVSSIAEGPPTTVHPPAQSHFQLAAGPNPSLEPHHAPAQSHSFGGEASQHMQTEQ